MRTILAFFPLLSLSVAVFVGKCPAQITPRFHAGDFLGPQYTTSDQVEHWKGVRVKITQVKFTPVDHSSDPWPFMCRAWISVSTPTHNRELYFGDIEPMGLSYGLFLPAEQPSPHHLLILKVGDYDGHLILIRGDGRVSEVHGEGYLVDEQRELLFTTHAEQDRLKLLIFDLASDRILLDNGIPFLGNWYRDDRYGIVFSAHSEQVAGKEDRRGVYKFDSKSQKLDYVSITASEFSKLKPISYPFDESQFEDCSSPTSRRKAR
ncbi:MAG TPA: hypothetical protein VFC29_13010 [Candidatus Limnocylindrales bacterium]|nr:hypothetical protein [Candidatus Limnocylindrales bacterium]